MNIPKFSWDDMISRTGSGRTIVLSEFQQYVLQQMLSYLQLNPESTLLDYYDFTELEIDEGLSSVMNALMDETMVNSLYPKRVIIRPDEHESVAGSAVQWSADAAQYSGGIFQQSTVAINNKYFFVDVQLRKGNWHWRLITQKTSGSGIVTLAINNVNKTTIDLYNSTVLRNQNLTGGDFTVSSNEALIELRLLSKNASSSNYDFRWNVLILEWEND